MRGSIRMYASSLRRDMTPAEEAQRAASFVDMGYSAYKLHSAVPGAIDDPADQTLATVKAVRDAVGDDIEILVDVNGAFSTHHAMDIGRALEDMGVFHFEEPRPHYDLPGLATIADALDIPIASGEMIYHPCPVRRPDNSRKGGHPPTRHRQGPGVYRVPADRRDSLGFRQAHHGAQHPAHHQHRGPPARVRCLCQHPLCPGIQYRALLHPGPVAHYEGATGHQKWLLAGARTAPDWG